MACSGVSIRLRPSRGSERLRLGASPRPQPPCPVAGAHLGHLRSTLGRHDPDRRTGTPSRPPWAGAWAGTVKPQDSQHRYCCANQRCWALGGGAGRPPPFGGQGSKASRLGSPDLQCPSEMTGMEKPISIIETHLLRRQSTMGLEPVGAEAKRTLGHGLHRAIGAPSEGTADTEWVNR